MSYLTEHPRARWIAPAAAVVLVAGASFATSRASADPTLPPKTAQELLVDLQGSEVTPMSGTVVQTANLGLPALPGLTGGGHGPGGSSEFSSMLSGTHTLRLWYGGPEQVRIALVGNGGESDLIRNGRDVWIWSSSEQKATHHTLPEHAKGDHAKGAPPARSLTDLPKTPEEAAEQVLAMLDPSTVVTTDGTATVAGRAAYELVLEPKATNSLVEDVRIAVDAEKDIPLRVQVHSTKIANPALEVAFTDVDFSAPEPRMFEFSPPPGTEVTEGDEARDKAKDKARDKVREHGDKAPGPAAEPTIVGSGWETVVVADVGDTQKLEGDSARLIQALPKVSGDWGSGHLLTGTLFSAVLTDDDRLAVGMVAPDALYAALSDS